MDRAMKVLRIGTRGSQLALHQAHLVKKGIETKTPGLRVELVVIKTAGELQPDASLLKISGDGIFTKELDQALSEGRVDLAVHSLKDLPSRLHDGIELAAVTRREEAGDAFVSGKYERFMDLPKGARVGTGSPRRKAQVLAERPDLEVVGFRGNVETRLRKLDEGEADALILAVAGLVRLGLDGRIRERLPVDRFVPAPGQGALGVTSRRGDEASEALAGLVQHTETARAVAAERAFLFRTGGGCKTPMACHAYFKQWQLQVIGFVASPDGKIVFRDRVFGPGEKAAALGGSLAGKLLQAGAEDILNKEE